ncbi:signal transduction histidine kinase [Phyllobacterium myrsinacearum]|nr:signal transduction histidine kinase [Phyllobacterium myrsinacearum]
MKCGVYVGGILIVSLLAAMPAAANLPAAFEQPYESARAPVRLTRSRLVKIEPHDLQFGLVPLALWKRIHSVATTKWIGPPRPVISSRAGDKPAAILYQPAVTAVGVLPSPSNLLSSTPVMLPKNAVSTLLLAACAFLLGLFVYRSQVDKRRNRKRALTEEAILNAIARLSPANPAFRRRAQDILQRIEANFGLSCAALIALHPTTLAMEDIYTSEAETSSSRQLFGDAVMEIRRRGCARRDMTLWHYPNFAARHADGSVGGKPQASAFTSIAWLDNRLGVMLVGRCLTSRRNNISNTQALHRITRFLAFALEGKMRVEHQSRNGADERTALNSGKDIAGRVAHEFNNLLTSIAGYAEMAADTLNPGSPPHAYIKHIQKAGARAKLVIEQTLDASRQHHKDTDAPFDVVASTSEILSDLRMTLPASQTVSAQLPEAPVRIYGNPIKLQQAVTNLCKNASDAMRQGGSITLSVAALDQHAPQLMLYGHINAGRYVRISIEDTGHGIAEGDLQRIFTPYFTTKPKDRGTGLGLAIVYQTVRRLNGAIDVHSKPGSGTCFHLYFPEIIGSEHVQTDDVEFEPRSTAFGNGQCIQGI